MEFLKNSSDLVASFQKETVTNLSENYSTLVVEIFWDLQPTASVYVFPVSSSDDYGVVYGEVLEFWSESIRNKADLISAFSSESAVRFKMYEVVPVETVSYDSGVRDEILELKVAKLKSFTLMNS